MEPLDEETKQWLAESARIAEAKRTAYYKEATAAMYERKRAEAQRILSSMPPPLPGYSPEFVSIFRAEDTSSDACAVMVEGVVFDVYGVMCGKMDGRDDFTGFDLITAAGEISMWRHEYPQITRRSRVRIKFIDRHGYGSSDDHMDDEVLEVWIEQ